MDKWFCRCRPSSEFCDSLQKNSMHKTHQYRVNTAWTGNTGTGTSAYRAYERTHVLAGEGKSVSIPASSDPSFRGDKTRYNPEELLVASLSSCHMLWYLHLCSEAGVVVTAYEDAADGVMEETVEGGGRFVQVTLHPLVTVAETAMIDRANSLHAKAHHLCFIANSVNFPVNCEAACKTTAV